MNPKFLATAIGSLPHGDPAILTPTTTSAALRLAGSGAAQQAQDVARGGDAPVLGFFKQR